MKIKADMALNKLDYSVVKRYWGKVDSSIMGPYMMENFGFPISAGHFRFNAESSIVQQLLSNARVDTSGTVLDLGSGVGYWAEFFAKKFNKVLAVESSTPLYESMVQRCSSYRNFRAIHEDVMSFEPEGRFSLIFLGGLLMYLNENDVVALLQKLKSFLSPNGIILCRETTVRNGTLTKDGEYQAVYRSIKTYLSLFNKSNLTLSQTCLNTPYVLMQVGCELVKKWKSHIPENLQAISTLGHLTYLGLRLGNPWVAKFPSAIGFNFPKLKNHFFVLYPETKTNLNNKTRFINQ